MLNLTAHSQKYYIADIADIIATNSDALVPKSAIPFVTSNYCSFLHVYLFAHPFIQNLIALPALLVSPRTPDLSPVSRESSSVRFQEIPEDALGRGEHRKADRTVWTIRCWGALNIRQKKKHETTHGCCSQSAIFQS